MPAVYPCMRYTVLLAIIAAAGCANRPALEELEREALMTGDWSAVEAREAAQARRSSGFAVDCPSGTVAVCYEVGLAVECGCVEPHGRRVAR